MATFTARVTVAPLDRQLLVTAVPAVLQRLRGLTFGDDGSLVHDGRRIEGLRVDRGVHPRVGTRYTAVFTPPPNELAPEPEPVRYEVVADDARQTVLRTETGSPVTTVLVTLQNPADPTELRCDFRS